MVRAGVGPSFRGAAFGYLRAVEDVIRREVIDLAVVLEMLFALGALCWVR